MRAAVVASLLGACGFRGQEVVGDGDGHIADAPRAIDAAPPVANDAHASPDAPPVPGDAMVDAGPLVCPITTGWVTLNGGGHYYYSPDGDDKHWSAAEADCEARGTNFSSTHLAVIGTLQEAIDVGGHMSQVGNVAMGGVSYAWIGMFQPLLSASKSAGWLKITGGAAYANWANGEPSDGGNAIELGTENFAQIYQPGDFNDAKASDTLHYICECDGIAADFGTKLQVPLN